MSWAIGILAVLFSVSAFVSERYQPNEPPLRKDLLWGLAAGGIGIVVSRL